MIAQRQAYENSARHLKLRVKWTQTATPEPQNQMMEIKSKMEQLISCHWTNTIKTYKKEET